jgi:membrane-bound ClpP family serine protease
VLVRPLPLVVLLSAFAATERPAPPLVPGQPVPAWRLKGFDPDGGKNKTVYEVPIDGDIDLGLASFVERVMGEAKPGDVVMLRIKTFGGRIDAAVRIRDALLDTKATTVAYIDHRAISAGALISLACDTIIMSTGDGVAR